MEFKMSGAFLAASLLMLPMAMTLSSTSSPTSTSNLSSTPQVKLSSPTATTTEKATSTSTLRSTAERSSTVQQRETSTSEWTTVPPSSTSTSTVTATSTQPTSVEWKDMDEAESKRLVDFVVAEIQKLKVEHKELDDCQELMLSSVLSGKKLGGKVVKYSVTLKVQPQVKNVDACLQQNATTNNNHPEICEADVTEGDRGGTDEMTLLRSTCLQVEELQD